MPVYFVFMAVWNLGPFFFSKQRQRDRKINSDPAYFPRMSWASHLHLGRCPHPRGTWCMCRYITENLERISCIILFTNFDLVVFFFCCELLISLGFQEDSKWKEHSRRLNHFIDTETWNLQRFQSRFHHPWVAFNDRFVSYYKEALSLCQGLL